MIHDPEVLDQLERLNTQPWSGVAYRHMFEGYEPLRANRRGARWNPPETLAIYTSLDRDTALAGAEYRIGLEPFRPKKVRNLYQISVKLERIIDLTSHSVLARLGVTPELLKSDDYSACQKVGGAAAWLGRDGILVPSVRAAGINLVIFQANMTADCEFEVDSKTVIS